ncbi:hypothetical protein Bca52824_028542 [Brassica carinata]|uniref:B3 domain-containing protein n=1 Tax=Brassica carinata TaxID=52824 RepID=A0A8X7VCY6_BRACI|nr:hypothetical protein Bca52824_028542 [Brassica carinata]
MEGDRPRKKRRTVQRKETEVNGQGNVAEETTETITSERISKLMKKYKGYDAKEMMELKELKPTDLDTNQGRLSMPKHVDRCFLNDGELETLAAVPKKGVRSLFIDTNAEEYDLELRDWANGLVLTKGWGNVIHKKVFKVGEKYPLWCFRSRNKNDKLCFTLVKPDQVDPIEALPNVDNKDAVSLLLDCMCNGFYKPLRCGERIVLCCSIIYVAVHTL